MKKWRIALLLLIGLFLLVGAAYFFFSPNGTTVLPGTAKQINRESSATLSVDHIFIIMEENKPASLISDNPSVAPYINSLIDKYGIATNYTAVTSAYF